MSLAIYIVILLVFAALMGWMAHGFIRTPAFRAGDAGDQPITVIICARNEERYVGRCLRSLIAQNYTHGLIQLIFINDASEDHTVMVAEKLLAGSGLNYRIISNANRKGKKASIEYAMSFATHELILLRDADTFTDSSNCLRTISAFQQQTSAQLIIGPVAVADNFGLLWALQAVEANVLALVTAGSAWHAAPFLCSGANLIFTRQVFHAVNGYSSHVQHQSGDDVFFLEDVKRLPAARIFYLKSPEALVRTYPTASLKALLHQRSRWAAKYRYNPNVLNRATAAVILVTNAAWLFAFIYIFLQPLASTPALLYVLTKLAIDILLLFLALRFIKNKRLALYALPVALVYPVYSVLVSLTTVFIKPRWKQ